MSLEKDLVDWYRVNRRQMPWREDPTPYHVYLSEIMCQQTQVDTVIPYFLRFVKRFPTLPDLAKSEEGEVLKLWEGLGYYSRGRNLHKAAQVILQDFAGAVPSKKEDLLSLPGIGAYTSKAILAIAFHQKEIAVDGNLMRVFSRLSETKEDDLEKCKALCDAYFQKALNQEDPSAFNQALMDLGEMVCLPHTLPLCEKCPLKAYCLSQQDGTMLDYPPAKKAKEKKQEDWTVFLVEYQDKFALEQRPDKGLLASLFQFPLAEGNLSLAEAKALWESRGYPVESIVELGEKDHVFSHLVWHLRGYRIVLSATIPNSYRWANKADIKKRYSIPSAFAYYKSKI